MVFDQSAEEPVRGPVEGRAMLDMAFGMFADELEGMLDKLTGTGTGGGGERVVATEHRLILSYGGRGGIIGVDSMPLGAVHEDYARAVAERQRREHATGVVIERRRVMRAPWEVVDRLGGEIPAVWSGGG